MLHQRSGRQKRFGVSKASLSRPRFTCSSGGRTGRLCKMLKAWRSARGADEMCLQTRMKLKHKHFIFNREDSQLTNELQSCWWGDFFVFGQKQPFWSMKRHQFYTLKVSLQVSGITTALGKKYKEPTLPTMQINYCVYQITCSLHWSNKMSHATILLQLLNVYI